MLFINKVRRVIPRDRSNRFYPSLVLTLILFITATTSSLAETPSPEQINALVQETRALREEVNKLKQDLKQDKQKQGIPVSKQQKENNTASTIKNAKVKKKTSPLKPAKEAPNSTPVSLGGYSAIIAPYLGRTPAIDGADLLTNLSQQNSDLLALQYRQELAGTSTKQRVTDYYLILSGGIGGQLDAINTYVGRSTSDVDVTIANITALAGIGSWVTAFLSFDYDNLPLASLYPPQFGPRIGNSRIYLDQGYITVGNLDKSDWYASVGQMYVPFGLFNSFMINGPLTAALFTTAERPLLLGYSHSNGVTELDLNVYAYQGDTYTSVKSSAINEWGLGADYYVRKANWSGSIGAGFISNIADAEGMQLNGQGPQFCNRFGGFAFPCNNGNVLVHRVPGFDMHATWTMGAYSLLAEYLTATRTFNPLDMSYGHEGARPQALDLEASYLFTIYNRPTSISIGYGSTKEALALLLPAQEFSLTLTTSIWRNTTESLGFQHDINYGNRSLASGQTLPVYTAGNRANLGKSSNIGLVAISVFF